MTLTPSFMPIVPALPTTKPSAHLSWFANRHHRNSSHGQMRRQWAPSVGQSCYNGRHSSSFALIYMPTKTTNGDPIGLIGHGACREACVRAAWPGGGHSKWMNPRSLPPEEGPG